MNRKQGLIAGLILLLLAIGLSLWAYPQMPPRVPTHWDLAGNVNGYSTRLVAVTLTPAIVAFTWLLMVVLPGISPRGFRLGQSARAFYESLLAVMAALVVIHFIALRASLGVSGLPPAFVFVPVGALLAILGNLMGKFHKNFFIGIRTPWTLASDEVWLRTNRLAGRLMVAGGLLLIVSSFASKAAVAALIVVIVAIVMIPATYSYVLYKRIEGFGAKEGDAGV
ncbi:MAG: SdpI family protein [Candidatus Eremiobacteraeota bacterium]|nr:SdpI family protein [Candidatus Eremiobacteraeota bacterium]MBV8499639.1 SdpI family protein [Candidatus Eremiobacteraeota bacterium]